MEHGPIREALAALRVAVGQLIDADRTCMDDAALIDEKVEFERLRRQLDAIEVAQLSEIDRRAVAGERGYANTATMLTELLRVSPADAKARVARARDLGPRRELTGSPLPPIFPTVAAAQRDGEVSVERVRVITTCLDRIPARVPAEVLPHAEQFLVEQARHFDARKLGAIANRRLANVDPDGAVPRQAEQQRRRSITISRRPDGSFVLHGQVTAQFVACWNPILDTLAAPVPSEDGIGDDRTAPQRRHDALLEVANRLLRSGALPDCGGVPVSVVVSMSESQLRERTGTASTDHDEPIPVAEVLDLAAEADVIPVVLDDAGGVVSFGRTRRTTSPGQRRALFARDGGCCFPGCTRPASWCQSHHVLRWEDDGHTLIDNLCLLCRYHHREFEPRGWQVRMRAGVPEWIPPEWLDPLRRPVRNSAHHLPEFDFANVP